MGEENRRPPKVSFNAKDKLPGRLQRGGASKKRKAGPVNFIVLFGLMS